MSDRSRGNTRTAMAGLMAWARVTKINGQIMEAQLGCGLSRKATARGYTIRSIAKKRLSTIGMKLQKEYGWACYAGHAGVADYTLWAKKISGGRTRCVLESAVYGNATYVVDVYVVNVKKALSGLRFTKKDIRLGLIGIDGIKICHYDSWCSKLDVAVNKP